jgi:hypothetical protein
MATNECGDEVPRNVETRANELGCLYETCYVYREHKYGGRYPVASIGCSRAERFRNTEYLDWQVELQPGWVAFRFPNDMARTQFISSDVKVVLEAGRLPTQDANPWFQYVRPHIEHAIDDLVREFLDCPYLHRVEHSLHARLLGLLSAIPALAGIYPVGNGLAITQLIHKEWSETIARPESRRGNFDLAVLSPHILLGCNSLEDFRAGRLPAPFVIEMGLDDNFEHLANDARKLQNSRPPCGYLIHLVREGTRDDQAEQLVRYLEECTGIRTAYAWKAGGQHAWKLLGDSAVRVLPSPA